MQVTNIFRGCWPAIMTPCSEQGVPDFDALVNTAQHLVNEGMAGVVYAGSMGEWPMLSSEQRKEGVRRLVEAGIQVVVGTGAQNPALARDFAVHAKEVGAAGLMVIPRQSSRTTSAAAQKAHFQGILEAASPLPCVVYNSKYYGFSMRADMFFELREAYPNLVGFKEFCGVEALTYAAEFITRADPDLSLMVGVDTAVYHGYVNCGAVGAITGVGNALPQQVLTMIALCEHAASGRPGCAKARQLARALEEALGVLSKFDEGPDLVLYYKHLMVLAGHPEYAHVIEASDALSDSQRNYLTAQYNQFMAWWEDWEGRIWCEAHLN